MENDTDLFSSSRLTDDQKLRRKAHTFRLIVWLLVVMGCLLFWSAALLMVLLASI
ncbi:hypothetical protein [Serratia bockelmannii]|uniref:hypothetical protein n=1 Tax=Serratia bockelmannii TaxID=2703793 RepID=UPI003FA77123